MAFDSIQKALGMGPLKASWEDELKYHPSVGSRDQYLEKIEEIQKQAMVQAMQNSIAAHQHSIQTSGNGQHSHGMHTHTVGRVEPWHIRKVKALRARLDVLEGKDLPFAFLQVVEGEDAAYLVIAVKEKSKPIVIEDDLGLFPSDTLITQLRLMIG